MPLRLGAAGRASVHNFSQFQPIQMLSFNIIQRCPEREEGGGGDGIGMEGGGKGTLASLLAGLMARTRSKSAEACSPVLSSNPVSLPVSG